MKVKSATWFTQMGNPQIIGIVIGEDEVTGELKAYIGSATGFDEDDDAKSILMTGAKLYKQTLVDLANKLTGE